MSKSKKMHKNTLSHNDSISPRIPPLWKYVSMYKCMCRKPGNLGRAIVLMSRLPLKAHRWRRTDKNIQYVPFGFFGWKRCIRFQTSQKVSRCILLYSIWSGQVASGASTGIFSLRNVFDIYQKQVYSLSDENRPQPVIWPYTYPVFPGCSKKYPYR